VLAEYGATEEGRVHVLDENGHAIHFEPPKHWRASPQMSLQGRFWLNVEDLSSETSMLDEFTRMLRSSMGKAVTRDRRDGLPRPTSMTVVKAQRIENLACLREYLQRRSIIKSNRSRCVINELEDIKLKVNYSKWVGSETPSPLDKDLNEVWLLHGTSSAAALKIAKEDFLMSLAGTGAGTAFGAGIYFAEEAMKADEYTEEAPTGHAFAGLRPLLLCRVLLGKCLETLDTDVKDDLQHIKEGSFDSLLADRKAAVNTYREFVVYDHNQACVEYILWYRRVM